MEKPRKTINFRKNDSVNKFVGNVLDLYNIDYNPDFLDFSLRNFQSKIKDYLNIIREDNFYLNSVSKIKSHSDIKELQTVLNEHELHLVIEGLDFLLQSSLAKKRELSHNIQKNVGRLLKQKGGNFLEQNGAKLLEQNGSKLLEQNGSNQKGGGTVAKYDIIAYLNGDKRNKIKGRICDIIYFRF